MIITGKDAKTPLIEAAGADNPSDSSPQMDPPPSYGTISGHSYPVQPYPAQPYSTQYIVQEEPIPRRSATKRFCGACLYAVLIWFLVSMLVQSIVVLTKWSHRHGGWHVLQGWSGKFPVPTDITVEHCIQGGQWVDEQTHEPTLSLDTPPPWRYPFSAETSFDLPLSYDTLFMLSRGSQSHGTINVVTSQSTSQVARVHVVVRYLDRDIRDSGAKACLVQRRNNQLGVGIFTRGGPEHALDFETTIFLPILKNDNEPLQIKNFETDMPNTRHKIGDLRALVDFQHISLKSSNAPIHVNSLSANRGTLRTSNGLIEGAFNTSGSLSLKTSNAPIRVEVGLQSYDNKVTQLTMHTSNGKLDSDISLMSSLAVGGRYLATVSTSNSPLHVRFPTAPVDSALKLRATTSNSPASVLLHPSYEGSFDITSDNFLPLVRQHEVEDPARSGRARVIEYSKYSGQNIRGQVAWSPAEGPGSVIIKSSNSPATIEL